MPKILNTGKITSKLRIGERQIVFNIGISEHPDDAEILRYVKINPNLSIVNENVEKPKEEKIEKKKRKVKEKAYNENLKEDE